MLEFNAGKGLRQGWVHVYWPCASKDPHNETIFNLMHGLTVASSFMPPALSSMHLGQQHLRRNFGNSVLKVLPAGATWGGGPLSVADWFTPFDYQALEVGRCQLPGVSYIVTCVSYLVQCN